MKLVEDRHVTGEGGHVEVSGSDYQFPTEELLKKISSEYARVCLRHPNYKFEILLDTQKGELHIYWHKL
jgi:hypothetical protein